MWAPIQKAHAPRRVPRDRLVWDRTPWHHVPRPQLALQLEARHRRFSHRTSRRQFRHRVANLHASWPRVLCRSGVGQRQRGRRRSNGLSLHPVRYQECRRIGSTPDMVAVSRNNLKRRAGLPPHRAPRRRTVVAPEWEGRPRASTARHRRPGSAE